MRQERYYIIFVLLILVTQTFAQNFVHPGISHKTSDLERMKYNVEAGVEPWLSTFNLLKQSSYASYNYNVNGNPGITTLTSHTPFINDGFAAYYNALMWYITGDVRHAEKCVEIFNSWVNITRIEDQFPLNNGRGPWKMLEGAEIIRSTYDGWAQADIERFKAMLVYPGWSGTEAPTAAIASKDVSFYWNIYQGDPGRHGNQGLFGYRSLMAMGIFSDNEVMYERALRYLQGLPHRSDDLPYPSGPPVLSDKQASSNEYYDEYSQLSRSNEIEDYGYNEVMANYIWENGQSQESSRDQAHALGGVSIITCMCEMAWNQGDDLYGHLDNRPLLGLEYYFRYNLSWDHTYPDQTTPWEPTVESGEFIKRSDRTGRWTSLKINPYTGSDLSDEAWNRGKHNLNGIYEMNLGHYKDRLLLPGTDTKWLERGFQVLTETIGIENGDHPVDHPGYGGLKFHRVSPGDPISGFSSEGLPVFAMNVVPTTIEAENYDYFPIEAEGRTYHDSDNTNTGNQYRLDQGVDIATCSEGGYMLTSLEDDEWLSYTIAVPVTALYNISVRYASANANGKIKFTAAGKDITDEIAIPFGGENSNGLNDWKDLTIASNVILKQGAQALQINISGASDAFVLNNFTITEGDANSCADAWGDVSVPSYITQGINYIYYEGTWDNLPDFNQLSPIESGLSDAIDMHEAWADDNFAVLFTGYIEIPIDGLYTFFAATNEGSRLYIDGNLLIDNDGIHTATEVEGSACLNEGFHEIRVEYFEKTGDEELLIQYEGPGTSKRELEGLFGLGPCENAAIDLPEDAVPGIAFYYYEGNWKALPNFDEQELLNMGTTSSVNLNMATASDYFGIVLSGYLNVAKDGDYTFYTTSDDGSSLYIDGNKIVDNDGTHANVTKSGSTCLAAGWHQIDIHYFESTGGNSLAVQWEGDGLSKRSITGFYTKPVTAPVKENQTITFNRLTRYLGEDDFDAASTSSGLPLSYVSSNPDVATVVDGKIHLVGEGQARIVASQTGNLYFNAGTGVEYITVKAKESQTIAISDITKYIGDEDFDPAVASSGLPVSYTSFNYSIATIVDGKIHIVGPGKTYVRVSQEGDHMYAPANSQLFSLTVEQGSAINEVKADEVRLFPNPVTDVLCLEIADAKSGQLELFNMIGERMLVQEISSTKTMIDMSAFDKGVYFAKISNEGIVTSNKIVKR